MRIEPRTSPSPSVPPGVAGATASAPIRSASPTAPSAASDRTQVSGAEGASSAMGLSDMGSPTSTGQARQWTLAVNLTTTLADQFGAVVKAQQLRDLAKETEGKPVTIVAQQHVEGPGSAALERFVIKDGKVTSMGQKPSEGFAQDLESLLAWAASSHPAERMGVVIQSHGNAIDGMSGDNGSAELEEIAAAIQDGLAIGGRAQLDLLNFDACLMGQQEVLSAMAGVAEHVVASSELEFAHAGTLGAPVDGQPMREMVRALLSNPEMDGAALAQKTVELASQAARPFDLDRDGKADAGGKVFNATPTLAHYDMAGLATMKQALDGMGSALRTAMQDPKARKAIEDLIARTPRYAGTFAEEGGIGRQQRDLRSFAAGLQAAIAQGNLQDPSGALGKAAKTTLEALDGLVGAYHGEENFPDARGQAPNYRELGGFGVFLPSAEFARGTPDTMRSPLERVQLHAEDVAKQFAESDSKGDLRPLRDLFLDGAMRELGGVRAALEPQRLDEFEPLAEAFRQASTASPDAFEGAVRNLATALSDAREKGLDRPALEQMSQARADAFQEAYREAAPYMTDGWKQLTDALRSGS